MHTSLQGIEAEWQAMRGLTLELLAACSEDDLAFVPKGLGSVWKQFRHIGGIHEVYLAALQSGRIAFDGSGRTYSGDASREALQAYFQVLSDRHAEALSDSDPAATIDWFGQAVSLRAHLIRLISHETLHHGQFIQQWRMRGKALTPSWQAWGV